MAAARQVIPVLSSALEEALLRWLRAAELTCDRAALLVAQDTRVVVSALMKLAGGSRSFAAELNIDAFLRQARDYDEAASGPLGWYLKCDSSFAMHSFLLILAGGGRRIMRIHPSCASASPCSTNTDWAG